MYMYNMCVYTRCISIYTICICTVCVYIQYVYVQYVSICIYTICIYTICTYICVHMIRICIYKICVHKVSMCVYTICVYNMCIHASPYGRGQYWNWTLASISLLSQRILKRDRKTRSQNNSGTIWKCWHSKFSRFRRSYISVCISIYVISVSRCTSIYVDISIRI